MLSIVIQSEGLASNQLGAVQARSSMIFGMSWLMHLSVHLSILIVTGSE